MGHPISVYATRIRPSVQKELDAASAAGSHNHFDTASRHLQRAHVLAQASTFAHVGTHLHRFRFGVRNGVAGEAICQVWHIVAAALFTALTLLPEGNTATTAVPRP